MIICSILFLVILLFAPDIAIVGSKYGATLWLTELLPTLLPFFVVIRLFQEGMPRTSSHRASLLLGLLCGYPTGATLVVSQYNRGLLSRKKAHFYLGFVNNPSPMFVLVFCATSILHMDYRESFLLFGIVIVSGFVGSLFCFLFPSRSATMEKKAIPAECYNNPSPSSFSERMDAIILDSFILMVKIGGYVILFSILGQVVAQFVPVDSSFGILSLGSLEISCGISYLKFASLSHITKKVLTAILLTFGGVSAAAQTSSVLTNSELSIVIYVANKLINAIVAGILSYLLFCIL